jgi:hypothetical protein
MRTTVHYITIYRPIIKSQHFSLAFPSLFSFNKSKAIPPLVDWPDLLRSFGPIISNRLWRNKLLYVTEKGENQTHQGKGYFPHGLFPAPSRIPLVTATFVQSGEDTWLRISIFSVLSLCHHRASTAA